jgi:hypothetical protein
MAIEILLIGLAVVLFGGMLLGLSLSFRDTEARRMREAPPSERPLPAAFYGWTNREAALAEERILRQIEHHLRREALLAEEFVENPTPQKLRADERSRLGAC